MVCTPCWRSIQRFTSGAEKVSYRTRRDSAQAFLEVRSSPCRGGRRGERIVRLLLLSTRQRSTIALSSPHCFHSVIMFFGKAHSRRPFREHSFWLLTGQVERRQWWLCASAIVVTLLLTGGMASFSDLFEQSDPSFSFYLRQSVRGLVA